MYVDVLGWVRLVIVVSMYIRSFYTNTGRIQNNFASECMWRNWQNFSPSKNFWAVQYFSFVNSIILYICIFVVFQQTGQAVSPRDGQLLPSAHCHHRSHLLWASPTAGGRPSAPANHQRCLLLPNVAQELSQERSIQGTCTCRQVDDKFVEVDGWVRLS